MRFSAFKNAASITEKRFHKIKTSLTSLANLDALTNLQKTKINTYREQCNSKYYDFKNNVCSILASSDESEDFDLDVVSKLQETIDELYYDIISIADTIAPIIKPVPQESSFDDGADKSKPIPHLPNVRLPEIKLTQFSGAENEWVTFSNVFDHTIHKNVSLSNVEKMTYLVGCLSGNALSLVKSLSITDANYVVARQALIDRYQNTRLLVTSHVNQLLDVGQLHNPTAKQLRHFHSVFSENLNALKALDVDLTIESTVLVTTTLRCFDLQLRKKFETSREDPKVMPNIKELLSFIENECDQLEAASLSLKISSNRPGQGNLAQGTQKPYIKNVPNYQKPSLLSETKDPTSSCTFCKKHDHKIYKCSDFLNLPPQKRFEFIKTNSFCTNCLGTAHKYFKCNSSYRCNHCKGRHHSLLHLEQDQGSNIKSRPSSQLNTSPVKVDNNMSKPTHVSISNENQTSNVGCLNAVTSQSTVLLGTTLVLVTSQQGQQLVCRAVLDSAASSSFITTKVAQSLNLRRSSVNVPRVCGLAASQVKVKGLSHITISAVNGNSTLVKNHPVIILDNITTHLPRVQIDPKIKNRLQNLVLADPSFDKPAPIDLLIGADLFVEALLGEKISLGNNLPSAVNTIFGFIVLGNAPSVIHEANPATHNMLATLLCTHDLELHHSLQKFWLNEEPPSSVKPTEDEITCEKFFSENHSRDADGRYIIRLPFKANPETLGDSSHTALKQFGSLEKRFHSQPEFKEKYVSFMEDYIQSNHMSPSQIPIAQASSCTLLPHHGVFKNNKIRVVFNASMPTSSNVSLNEVLHTGPKLHNSINDIILNFRSFPVVFSCDIKQMFRQILVDPLDRKYQCIFWRKDPSKPLLLYELNTVVFGMACSPYLANRTILQLIKDEGHAHPLAAAAIKRQIFVDDLLLGCESVSQARDLLQDTVALMAKGGFVLRKWISSHPELLESVPPQHQETSIFLPDIEQSPNTQLYSLLGLKWFPHGDYFSYVINVQSQTPTKRTVLSQIAKLYDPMGWLTPCVLWAKGFMQLIWTKGLLWDDPLPIEMAQKWSLFVQTLPKVSELKISRHIPVTSATNIQLHAFCDASSTGYASCVYLRCVSPDLSTHTYLLIAKSRVSPLKQISLPRLELCGAHMLSKLLKYSIEIISQSHQIDLIRAWCDSTITLSWIQTPSYRLKTYVANRVAEIQENTPPDCWRHIASDQNPADCASRGLLPTQIVDHNLWWHGPQWLSGPEQNWYKSPNYRITDIHELPEVKPVSSDALNVCVEPMELISKFSSWRKLLYVTLYVLRFIHNLKSTEKLKGPPTVSELKQASTCIYLLVQKECFQTEIDSLKKGKTCSTAIQRLAPFLDSEGLLRVGGRLRHSNLVYKNKFPILLPKTHVVTNLIIDYYHLKYLHCGAQQLQALLSQEFWILAARSTIRARVFKCIRCFKCRPKSSQPLMGDLPSGRVTPNKCFSVSGSDFAGPYTIKLTNLRRLQPIKVYLCLFICFSTKAVHIEVVMDLSAEAFVAALTRFISRRGVISELYSDNATNYTGAANHLNRTFNQLMQQRETQKFFESHSIKFSFIPPRAPHMGGLWERAIQSSKFHLRRVLGSQVPTLEEFSTLVTRIEAILNSRPITPISNDPNDFEVLTPGHFITGGPLVSIPEISISNIPINRLRRWQLVQSYSQQIWSRWHKEYLSTLQQRSKWFRNPPNLKINDLVLLHEDNLPSLAWKIGRVTKLFPGPDDIVRVVEVKTATSSFKRPVSKLSLLPIEN